MKKLLLAILVVASSCSSIDCPISTKVAVNYGFYNASEQKDTLTDTLSVWSQRKDGTDTLLYNSGVNKTTLTLPISYQRPEDVLIFRIADTLKSVTLDTVWIKKEDIPHFESVDCAAAFFHELTDVKLTHHAIDSLVLINTSVTYDTKTIHFYLYPKIGN